MGLDSTRAEQARIRIAYVNQFCDILLPPRQNSIGGCTYGLARAVAREGDVTAFGVEFPGIQAGEDLREGVNFRFFPPSRIDTGLRRLHSRFSGGISRFTKGGMENPLSTSSLTFPHYGRRVATALVLKKPHIVHFQHTTQYIRSVKRINPDSKIVLTLHHERYPQTPKVPFGQRLQAVDKIAFVSRYVQEKTLQDYPFLKGREILLPNGVEKSEFQRDPLVTQKAEGGTKRILFVGAVSPQKGVHVLLEAFRTVREIFPDATLDIVGPQGTYPLSEVFSLADQAEVAAVRGMYTGDYANQLKESVHGKATSGIRFRGKVPREELLEHYYSADVFAFPSLWDEGFGLPPVEAMAAGLPVVATRSGAVPESVLEGETGLLVQKNDPASLAISLCKLLSRPGLRVKMGLAGRNRALDLFTWDHAGQKALALYRNLISGSG